MATTRKKPSKPRSNARKPAARRPRPQAGKAAKPRRKAGGASKATLDQRQRDLLGLALVALAIFIAFPLYSTGDAGIGGDQVVSGLLWALGQAAYLVPVALAGAGLLMILRPVLPVGGNVRIGAVMIVAFLALLLAAGTFGTGPQAPRPGSWQPEYFADRGGALGDGIYVGVASLVGPVGAHLLGIFGLIAGVLVLTGVSIATLLSGTSRSVAEVAGAARRAAGSLAPDPDRPAPIAPPEPEDEEPVVHAVDPWPSDELTEEEDPEAEAALDPDPEPEADPDATVALAEAPAEPEPLPAPTNEPRDG